MKKFKAPLDKNKKPYWIPIVVENKDILVAFMTGANSVLNAFELSKKDIDLMFGSERFNDVLPDGRRVGDMSDSEIVKYINTNLVKEEPQPHIENNPEILKDYYLAVDCTCGMFYGFNNINELPDKDMCCGVCEKKVIVYTGMKDSEFIYDGSTKMDLLTDPNPDVIKETTSELLESISEKTTTEGANDKIDKMLKEILGEEDFNEEFSDPEYGNEIKEQNLAEIQKRISSLNFELNKKIARVEVVDRLLGLDSISSDRRKVLRKESKTLEKDIHDLIKDIEGLQGLL